MKISVIVFLIFATLLQLPRTVKGCEVHGSDEITITRVSNCHTHGGDSINIEETHPETISLNFRQNSSVIRKLPLNIFNKFPNVELMVMNVVGLQEVPSGSFLGANNLKLLSLEKNHITRLEKETFKGATVLETLKLGKNNISWIDKEAFLGLENLKTLDLSRNDLEMISDGTFNTLTNLQLIDLNFNHLKSISKHLFLSMSQLKAIKLFKNDLQTFDINLQSDRNFCYLNIDNNSINYFSLTFTQLSETNDDDDMTCTSHGIHASFNEIEYFYVTKESTAVNLIVLNGNKMNNIENITQLAALTHIDLGNNPTLTEEALESLGNAKDLRGLSLKGLNLTKLNEKIFGSLEHLTELDVSNNLLENIDFSIFPNNLHDFYKLSLANNHLATLDINKMLEKFPHIAYLNVKGNQLTTNHLKTIVSTLKDVTVIQ